MRKLEVLRRIAKDLRGVGEIGICNKVLIAIADISETSDPRPDLSYSNIMRELRKKDKDRAKEFQIAYKEAFDEAYLEDIPDIEQVALMQAMKKINFDAGEIDA